MGAAACRKLGPVLTTGQAARVCRVAPRTISKWFDTGLLKGYRLPGCGDRRIPRESLVKFLESRGIPLGDLAAAAVFRVLWVGCRAAEGMDPADGYEHAVADSWVEVGVRLADWRPDAVVIDFALGRVESLGAAALLRTLPAHADTLVIGVAGEDEPDPDGLCSHGFDVVFKRPLDRAVLAAPIAARKEAAE